MDGSQFRLSLGLATSLLLLLSASANAATTTYKSTVEGCKVAPDSLEIGIMGGFSRANTNGVISTSGISFPAATSVYGSDNSTNGEFGVQLRQIIEMHSMIEPYVYFNAQTISGTTSSMNMGAVLTGAQASTISSTQNWVSRIGVGFQTDTIIHHLAGGFGIGVALYGQTLKSTINEPGNFATHFQSYSKIFQPTMMANLTWQFCQSCVGGYPASLAAQLSLESYRRVSLTGTTLTGNTYVASIDQHWVPHGDLILSVRLPD